MPVNSFLSKDENPFKNSISGNASIQQLPLSGRSINALHRHAITTLTELRPILRHSEDILSWPAVGKMVYDEIVSLPNKLKINYFNWPSEHNNEWKMAIIDTRIFQENKMIYVQQRETTERLLKRLQKTPYYSILPYSSVEISTLIKELDTDEYNIIHLYNNVRPRANLYNVASITSDSRNTNYSVLIADGDVLTWKQCTKSNIPTGNDPFDEVKKGTLTAYTSLNHRIPSVVFFRNPAKFIPVIVMIYQILEYMGITLPIGAHNILMARILAENALKPLSTDEKQLYNELAGLFFNNDVMLSRAENEIKVILKKSVNGLERGRISDFFPVVLQLAVEKAIKRLFSKNEIFEMESKLYLSGRRIKKWIQNYPNARKREIVERRLNGETLEDVGAQTGLTRERVRQITKSCFQSEIFYEDRYAYVFKTYYFDHEQVKLAFGTIAGNYLNIRYTRGIRKLEEAMEDESIPEQIKVRVQAALERDYIYGDGVLIRKNGNEIKNYIIRTHCLNETTVEEYKKYYKEFCKKNDIKGAAASLEEQSIVNKLHNSLITVTSYGKKFRYYPIMSMDYTDLFEGIHLKELNDVEYSAQFFYREYPELMAQYDIRNGFELHNLLKKIVDPEEYPNVEFGRMPIIRFGDANREKQVLDLLMDCPPTITSKDLSILYEERYGVSSATFIANYSHAVSAYCYGGEYQMNTPALPEDVKNTMNELLTDDFYLTRDLRKMYCKAFPKTKESDITPIVIRQLGFMPYQGYVIRAQKYHSATEYIENLLLKKTRIKVSSLPSKLTVQHLFSRLFMHYKQQLDIIEVKKGELINIEWFRKKGITKKQLEEYVEHVEQFEIKDKFFSIRSLHTAGFSDPLDKLKMGDWFYATLIQQRSKSISTQRIGSVKILCRCKRTFNIAEFIEWVVTEHNGISVNDLISMLKEVHGIELDRRRTLIQIAAANLYMDRVSDRAYIVSEELKELMKERRKQISDDEETDE